VLYDERDIGPILLGIKAIFFFAGAGVAADMLRAGAAERRCSVWVVECASLGDDGISRIREK
jgi:hypothetical protein